MVSREDFIVYRLLDQNIPDELTLHLIAEREVIPLQTEWRVPLSK
ncbi:hypothetical protein [Ureibacillus sp. FSL K6-3587]